MEQDENSSGGELEPQPSPERTPPGTPPRIAAGVADQPPAPPPAGSPWSVTETLPIILLFLLLGLLSMLPGPEPKASGRAVLQVLVFQTALYAVFMLYIAAIVSLRHRLPFWRGLGWRPVNASLFLFMGLVLAIAVQFASPPEQKQLPIERMFQTREGALLLTFFGVAIAPLAEEIIFRGFVFVGAVRSWGVTTAVWFTALLFALIHVPQLRGGLPQMFAIFGVGLVLSYVRARVASLAASYFMHLAYNTTLFVLLFIGTRGFTRMT